MDLDFVRGSFGHNRRFGWLLGVVIILLAFLEPVTWYAIVPAKEETSTTSEISTSTEPAAGSGTTSIPPSTTAAPSASPQAVVNTQGRSLRFPWKPLEAESALAKCPPKHQSLRRIIQRIKKEIA